MHNKELFLYKQLLTGINHQLTGHHQNMPLEPPLKSSYLRPTCHKWDATNRINRVGPYNFLFLFFLVPKAHDISWACSWYSRI